MNIARLVVDDPDEMLNTGAFGAGAKVRLEYSADGVSYTEDSTQTIVTGTFEYTFYHTAGTSTTYYRTRYSNSGGSSFSDYSDVFQVNTPPLDYASLPALKMLVNITDATDDGLLELICGRVNQYIESVTKQPIGPIASATYLYDGNDLTRVFLPTPVDAATLGIGGMRAVTLVEFAPYTAGTFETIASTDYVLRGRHGVVGPYRWLVLSDLPAGSYSTHPEGRGNIRITGTAGWSAIPDDVTEMALNIASHVWAAHQVGSQQIIGNDSEGIPVVSNYVGGRDRETLKRYTLKAY